MSHDLSATNIEDSSDKIKGGCPNLTQGLGNLDNL